MDMANYKKIFIILLFATILILPLATHSIGGCRELEVPIPGLTSTCLPVLPEYIVAIFNFALMIIGLICFGALLYGGFRYLTSAGKPAALADAKDQIFSALLGLIILLSSWLILNTINPELLILNPVEKPCDILHPCPPGQQCIGGFCSAFPESPGGSWTNCSFYFIEKDCTNAKNEKGENCLWCSACLRNHINTISKTDRCVDPDTPEGCDGYTCSIGECGADCEVDCAGSLNCVDCVCQ
jgi:hypothetical protein